MVDVSGLTAGLTKAVAPSATAFLTKVGKEKYNRFIATYTNVFRDHIRATGERCSKIKTILYRDQPISLESQYVQLLFKVGDQEVSDRVCVNESMDVGNALLVSGLAGCGKSMFMKWAALRLIESIPVSQRIPLFVEIREVTAQRLELPFDQIIFQMSSSELSRATFEQFHIGLTEGIFILMVDGLDEVPVKNRESILNEITDFRRRFPKASLICSSRPDRQLESSNALKVYRVLPMNLGQISEVIDNAVFDEEKKTSFREALESGLYDQHKSFLSNPLLATIMLITYDAGSGVPSKLSLFYSQVYETLFYKHDSSKGVYVREHHSGLDIDQFESAFRTFCFQTYAMSKITFAASDLMTIARSSIEQVRINADVGDFLKDCKKSLCLLQDDGIFTSFVHRSFQEYFSARYLASYGGKEYYSLVDQVVTRSFSDNTFKMLYQIDPEDVLRRWCLPKLEELRQELLSVNLNSASDVSDYVRAFATAAYFRKETGNGLAFAHGLMDHIRFFYAVNEVLAAAGLTADVGWYGANVYKDRKPEDAPPKFMRLMEREENDGADEDEAEDEDEDDDDGENTDYPYTDRHFVTLSKITPDIVMDTGFPELLANLIGSLENCRSQIERRLDSRDDFARQVSELFGNSAN